MRKLAIYTFVTLAFLFLGSPVQGLDVANNPNESLLWLFIIVLLGMSVVCIVLALTVLALIAKVREKTAETAEEAVPVAIEQKTPLWERLKERLTAAVPITREAEIDLGHDYDGIRELDNKLPPWWLYGFYLTIAISIVYLFYYHVATDWSSDSEFKVEMAEAAKIKEAYLAKVANLVNEETVQTLDASDQLSFGKTIYDANCKTCHGNLGEGGIGPNLCDEYWLHGGGIKNVFKTVKYGIPEKGMIPWKDVLKPLEIQQVSSFILTFQGTNPPNAKEPQGDPWSPPVPMDSVNLVSMQ